MRRPSAAADPAQRLSRPAQLAALVLSLDDRRQEFQRQEEEREHKLLVETRRAKLRARLPWVALTCVIVLAASAISAILYSRKKSPPPSLNVKSVAVLPFQEIGPDHSDDYLRFALADEIATTLSYDRGLSVRPFRMFDSSKEVNIDLLKIGQAMGVHDIVTGHLLKQESQLQVTIEAFDVQTKNLLWRDTIDLPSDNLIQMHERITATVREGLTPFLGPSSNLMTANTHPGNAEAYEDYLRSLALNDDIWSNRQAIGLLDKATSLDPNYAPVWSALALRHYNLGSFGGGSKEEIRKAEAAAERAQALDPNLTQAGDILGRIWAEDGQLIKAYREALSLIQRRPDSGYAHFTMSYVLRYAGLLHEAARQCEIARSTDPHDPGWRSCLTVYEQLGDFQQAAVYLNMSPPDSPWTPPHQIQQLVRQGKYKEAQAIGKTINPGWDGYNLLQACAGHRPEREIEALAEAVKPDRDSELNYAYAAHLSFCNKIPKSIRLLRLSIQEGHCPYPEIETDPLMANLRAQPEYPEIRSEAIACQQSFLAAIKEAHLPLP
jgi:TolB-like protein